MFQDMYGRNMTVREQIADIMAATAMRWPVLPACSIRGGFENVRPPESEDRNIKALDALIKAVKYFPAVCVRDSDGTGPIVITDEFEEWGFPPSRFISDDFSEGDNNIDSVTVEFVRNNSIDGARWFGVHGETASRPGAHPFAAFEGK
jgi:hypothetical protein